MKTYIVLWVAPDTWSKAPEEDAPSGNLLAPVPCCCSPAKLTERFDPVSDWLRLSWSFSSSASRSLGLLSLRGRRLLLLEEVGAAAAGEEATVEDSPVKYFRSMLNIVAELNFSCVPSHFGRSSQWKRNHYVLQTSWNIMAQTFSMWSTRELPGVALVNLSNGGNFTGNGSTFMYIEISSYVNLQSLNTDYKQSTEAVNVKPASGTAPGLRFQ